MVSLKKSKELVVKHMLTEEQTVTAVASSKDLSIEVQHMPQNPAALKVKRGEIIKAEDEDYEKLAEQMCAAFTWAIFAIFVLLFIFSSVLDMLLPNMSILFAILEWLFGSIMLGTLIVNIRHALHIDL